MCLVWPSRCALMPRITATLSLATSALTQQLRLLLKLYTFRASTWISCYTSLLRVSDLSDGHLHYLKAVGFGVQDFLVHGDSLPVSQRFPFCFAVDRVFENDPNYTFAALQKATPGSSDIVDVLRQLPSDQFRLIDEDSLAECVYPPDLCLLGIHHHPEN